MYNFSFKYSLILTKKLKDITFTEIHKYFEIQFFYVHLLGPVYKDMSSL